MSSQKGNTSRTRAQKHQNKKVFKNDLHDTSKRTKTINSMEVTNVCDRCKAIIEWKIKYKKYKLLKNPSMCCKCNNKCVKQSYHTMCQPCSEKLQVCPKCGKHKDDTSQTPSSNVCEVSAGDGEKESDFDEDDSSSFSD